MFDRFGRKIDYLRISVTDRCNLRCIYCMPEAGIIQKPQGEILSFEQIYKIVKIAVGLGIQKIRITGGEPLLRKDLHILIKSLKKINGLNEIALTTNGILLSDYTASLKNAGLDRLNISLDSLVSKRFEKITRGADLNKVLDGIESTFSAGFKSIKINTVLIKDFNTDEILDFAALTRTRPLNVRFIEYMATASNDLPDDNLFFGCFRAKELCAKLGNLISAREMPDGTARVYKIEGFMGTIGFISPISEPFCNTCNKLRLTSNGKLKNCLHPSKTIDLKEALNGESADRDVAMLIQEAVDLKPQSHSFASSAAKQEKENFSMCQIGG